MNRADAGRAATGQATVTAAGGRPGRVRIGGLLVDRPPELYRTAPRGADWQAASLAVRVLAGACECCGRSVGGPARLQAAHLVAEVELHAMGPGLRERYLLDRRGLVALCKPCHGAFDFFVARVRDPRWLTPRRLSLLWHRRQRYAAGFAQLGRRRMVWLATILREVDGDGRERGTRQA